MVHCVYSTLWSNLFCIFKYQQELCWQLNGKTILMNSNFCCQMQSTCLQHTFSVMCKNITINHILSKNYILGALFLSQTSIGNKKQESSEI